MRGEDDFFSVARTMPFVAKVVISEMQEPTSLVLCGIVPLIPREVTPWFTALRAYSTLGLD